MARPTTPTPRARNCSDVSVLDHTDWVAKIVAGPICRDAGLVGPDREDVIAAAQLRLCELLARQPSDNPKDPQPFDPSVARDGDVIGAFRGWAHRSIRDAAVSEANRIRSGGMIRRKVRPENRAKAKCVALGDAAADIAVSEPVEVADERQVEEPIAVLSVHDAIPYGRQLATLYSHSAGGAV